MKTPLRLALLLAAPWVAARPALAEGGRAHWSGPASRRS